MQAHTIRKTPGMLVAMLVNAVSSRPRTTPVRHRWTKGLPGMRHAMAAVPAWHPTPAKTSGSHRQHQPATVRITGVRCGMRLHLRSYVHWRQENKKIEQDSAAATRMTSMRASEETRVQALCRTWLASIYAQAGVQLGPRMQGRGRVAQCTCIQPRYLLIRRALCMFNAIKYEGGSPS